MLEQLLVTKRLKEHKNKR